MKVCIVSWDNEAKELYDLVKETYEIRYVIERDCDLWGELDSDLTGISFAKAYRLYEEGVIEYFLIPCMRGIVVKTGIYDRLIRNGIPDERVLYAPLRLFKEKDLVPEERRALICRFSMRKEIDYLAMHIVDGCNLNCAFCSVFSGLCSEGGIVPFEEVQGAIDRLVEIFNQIVVFRILGGEPLMHPHWIEICRYVRKVFPLTDIEIVTNGTYILRLGEVELALVREADLAFDLTDYRILGDKIDEIHEMLCRHGVKHYITREIEYFSKLYDFEGKRDPSENYRVCKTKFMCMNMRGYELAVCHAAIGLERARKQFPDISYEQTGKIDIRTEGLTAKSIMQMMDHPHDMCRYCNQDLTEWRVVKEKENRKEWSV